jgi:hypothetical protein
VSVRGAARRINPPRRTSSWTSSTSLQERIRAAHKALKRERSHQDQPAFKARLDAAEHDPKWLRFKEQFKRIADEHEQAKQPKTDKPKVPQEWRDAVAKYAPPLPTRLKKEWLADTMKLLPREKGEAIRAYARRLFRNGPREGRPKSAGAIATRLQEQRTKNATK